MDYKKLLNSRYFGALLLAPFLFFLYIGGIWLKFFILILALIGMHEIYSISKEKSIHPISIAGYALCIAYYFSLGKSINYEFVFFALITAMVIMFFVPVFNTDYNYVDISMTLLAFLYVAVFFGFIVLIDGKPYGNYFTWLIFVSSWICDTCAYYTGRLFGKHKLIPKVSPKKTVEGAIGGFLGCIAACALYGLFAVSMGVPVPFHHFVLIGIINGVFSQFGDLAGSTYKRYTGVKDYGKIIPGHGGVLDRFESSLFSAFVIFYYMNFVLGM